MLTMFYDDVIEDPDFTSEFYVAPAPLQGPINTSLYDDAVRRNRVTSIKGPTVDASSLRGPLPSTSLGVTPKSQNTLMEAIVAGLIVWLLTGGMK